MLIQSLSLRSRFHSGSLRPAGKLGYLFLVLMALWAVMAPCSAPALPLESLDIGSAAILDTAGVLKDEEQKNLEQRLRDLHQRQLMQAAVVTVDSTDGMPIFDYGMKIAEKWQLGEAGKDNGLLMLIAVKDRKFHTFTGRGLESVLTDVSLTRIQRNAFPPNFRDNNYALGINLALDEMEKRLTADEQTLKKLLAEDKKEIEGGLLENLFGYGLGVLGFLGALALCVGLPFLILWAVESSYGIRRFITAPIAGLVTAGIALGLELGPLATAIAGVVGCALYILFARLLTNINGTSSSSGRSRRSSGSRSGRSSGGSSYSSSSSSGGYSGGGGHFGGGGSGGGW